jgi:hypothetical protein
VAHVTVPNSRDSAKLEACLQARVPKLELPYHLDHNNNNDGNEPVRIFALTLNIEQL